MFKELEYLFHDYLNLDDSYKNQQVYIKELEDENIALNDDLEELKKDFVNLPGLDQIDVESLKKSY